MRVGSVLALRRSIFLLAVICVAIACTKGGYAPGPCDTIHQISPSPNQQCTIYNYYAYIGTGNAAGAISGYSLNSLTGVLTSLPVAMPTDIAVQSELMNSWTSPNGQGLIMDTTVCCGVGHGTFAYLVNPLTGALTESSNSPLAAYQYGGAYNIPSDPNHYLFYGIGNGGPLYSALVNSVTGALTENTIAMGGSTSGVAVTHSGNYVYATDSGGADVRAYSVNQSTGVLSLINTYATAASNNAFILIDPQDRFLFVILEECGGNDVIYSYQINGNGTLTASGSITGSNEMCGGILGYTLDNSGQVLYEGAGTLYIFTINQGTGALAADGTFNASGGPVLVDPTNTYLITSGSTIRSMTGVSTGALVSTGFTLPGSNSVGVASFDPTSQFIYSVDHSNGDVWGVKLNYSNGALTAISGSNPMSFVTGPAGIVFVKVAQ
jgi:6-phosphogluconolactonase (cycloisomerase 2 family)